VVENLSKAAQCKVANIPFKGFEHWLTKALQGGAGKAHRWAKRLGTINPQKQRLFQPVPKIDTFQGRPVGK